MYNTSKVCKVGNNFESSCRHYVHFHYLAHVIALQEMKGKRDSPESAFLEWFLENAKRMSALDGPLRHSFPVKVPSWDFPRDVCTHFSCGDSTHLRLFTFQSCNGCSISKVSLYFFFRSTGIAYPWRSAC